jgi:hypothetical protein
MPARSEEAWGVVVLYLRSSASFWHMTKGRM